MASNILQTGKEHVLNTQFLSYERIDIGSFLLFNKSASSLIFNHLECKKKSLFVFSNQINYVVGEKLCK